MKKLMNKLLLHYYSHQITILEYEIAKRKYLLGAEKNITTLLWVGYEIAGLKKRHENINRKISNLLN